MPRLGQTRAATSRRRAAARNVIGSQLFQSVAAQKAMGLCLSPESKIKDVIEERVNFQAAFAISKRYTNDYLDKLVSQVIFNQGLAQNDTLPQSAVANVQPFYNK